MTMMIMKTIIITYPINDDDDDDDDDDDFYIF